MTQLNRKLDPEIESIYVIASPHYSFLSSTGVKEMATFGGDVSDLVPRRCRRRRWPSAWATGRLGRRAAGQELAKTPAKSRLLSAQISAATRKLTTC